MGDKTALVADQHLRTVSTMDKLRETLRDEHSFLMQARCMLLSFVCAHRSRKVVMRLTPTESLLVGM